MWKEEDDGGERWREMDGWMDGECCVGRWMR